MPKIKYPHPTCDQCIHGDHGRCTKALVCGVCLQSCQCQCNRARQPDQSETLF